MKTFLQLDNPGIDAKTYVVAPNDYPQVAQLTYVLTEDAGTIYFGQVMASVLWHNLNAEDRFSPSAHEAQIRIVMEKMAPAAYFNLAQVYPIDLLAEERHGTISAPMMRPHAGSLWRLATTAEIEHFLSLPTAGIAIGHIANVTAAGDREIPIMVGRNHICHHILSAGSTGSGKSNTNVNLIRAALLSEAAVIVYDQKPDYCLIDEPNDEPMVSDLIAAVGLGDVVQYWQLGTRAGPDAGESISVPVGALDTGVLAASIFYRDGEENQLETCELLLALYADQNNPNWTIQEFREFVRSRSAKEAADDLGEREAFQASTYKAIRNKIRMADRIAEWIDSDVQHPAGHAQAMAPRPAVRVRRDFFETLQAGQVNVIRIGGHRDARSYALFLEYAMRRVADSRAKNDIPPVVHLIDEAADIFRFGNRRLQQQMTSVVSEQVRKGRSLGIGFILSAQSAGDVPDQIRNNMNSVIVFRHRNPSILREIIPETANDLFPVAAKLQKGEAIVSLMGTPGPLRCKMLQSPARLYKPAWR